jgi:hypothetical protein
MIRTLLERGKFKPGDKSLSPRDGGYNENYMPPVKKLLAWERLNLMISESQRCTWC